MVNSVSNVQLKTKIKEIKGRNEEIHFQKTYNYIDDTTKYSLVPSSYPMQILNKATMALSNSF